MAILYCWSGAAGSGSGADWANAKTTLTAAFVTEVAGDTIYVAHDHAESTASAVTLTSSGSGATYSKIICVNRAGTVPPVSADRRTTATVTTTGASGIDIKGAAYFDGIIFNCGTGSSTANLIVNSGVTNRSLRFDNCSFRLVNTGASNIQLANTTSGGNYVELNNTTVSFASVNQSIVVIGFVKWRNTPSALLGTMPTTVLQCNADKGGCIEINGVDFSAAGSGKTIVGGANSGMGLAFQLTDCKLDAAATASAVPQMPGSSEIDFVRCGAGAVNYTVRRHRYTGLLDQETTIVRTGGASDGTTPIAWKIVTTANCNAILPFDCPPIAIWNDTTGASVTATIEGIWGGGAVPNNDEAWLEVQYLGDASSPQGSFVSDGKADVLATATAQTTSLSTWGGSTTKFKLDVSFTPQQKGWLYTAVKIGKASTTVYIDPLVTLT